MTNDSKVPEIDGDELKVPAHLDLDVIKGALYIHNADDKKQADDRNRISGGIKQSNQWWHCKKCVELKITIDIRGII